MSYSSNSTALPLPVDNKGVRRGPLVKFFFIFSIFFICDAQLEKLHASISPEVQYEMIGLMGGKSPVIVLKNKTLNKVYYLRSGDTIPGDTAIVKKIKNQNQIVVVQANGNVSRLSFYASRLQNQPDAERLKKWAQLKAYVLPYLKDENFAIDEDPNGLQDLIGIPMGTSEDITDFVLLENITE